MSEIAECVLQKLAECCWHGSAPSWAQIWPSLAQLEPELEQVRPRWARCSPKLATPCPDCPTSANFGEHQSSLVKIDLRLANNWSRNDDHAFGHRLERYAPHRISYPKKRAVGRTAAWAEQKDNMCLRWRLPTRTGAEIYRRCGRNYLRALVCDKFGPKSDHLRAGATEFDLGRAFV